MERTGEEKMSKQSPPTPAASAVGPCATLIQPGTESLPSTLAPPDNPLLNLCLTVYIVLYLVLLFTIC